MNNPIARPRVPFEILFVIGGWSGGSPTNMVETYDTRADRWVVCDAPDSGKIKGQMYIVMLKDRIIVCYNDNKVHENT